MHYILNKGQLEGLNKLIGDKNDISIFNNYDVIPLSEENSLILQEQEIISHEGTIIDSREFDILANPSHLTRFMITGGVCKYEYTTSYDKTRKNKVSFATSKDYYTIDNETSPKEILSIIGNILGKSNFTSISLKEKLSPQEALVLAALIDLEKNTILRALIDESPYTNNKYGLYMTWRMTQSSNKNIQWFVYCIKEIIGKELILELEQVKEILDQLIDKDIVTEYYGQYQLSDTYMELANRMLTIDSIMTIESIGKTDSELKQSAGFTCIQAGVNDILMVDSDGRDILIETVSSERLLEYIDKFLSLEVFQQ